MIRTLEKAPGAVRGRTQQKTGAIKKETTELPTPATVRRATRDERVIEPMTDEDVQAPPAVYRDTEKIAVLNLSGDFKIIRKGEEIAESYPCTVGKIAGLEETHQDQPEDGVEDQPKEGTEAEKRQEHFRQWVKDLMIEETEILKRNPEVR